MGGINIHTVELDSNIALENLDGQYYKLFNTHVVTNFDTGKGKFALVSPFDFTNPKLYYSGETYKTKAPGFHVLQSLDDSDEYLSYIKDKYAIITATCHIFNVQCKNAFIKGVQKVTFNDKKYIFNILTFEQIKIGEKHV